MEILNYEEFFAKLAGYPTRRFLFEACWAEEEECRVLVKENWGISSHFLRMQDVACSIGACVGKLSVWSANKRRNLKRDIADCQKALTRASASLYPGCWSSIRTLENKLDRLYEIDELYRKQRSRMEWLRGGDKNTGYFHWKASGRHVRNAIRGLFDEGGFMAG